MNMEAKEIKYLAQECPGGECLGLCLMTLAREGALWLPCCTGRASETVTSWAERGIYSFTAEIRAPELVQFPAVLSLQAGAGAVPCSSSISWLNGALTADFLLALMSTGSRAQLH